MHQFDVMIVETGLSCIVRVLYALQNLLKFTIGMTLVFYYYAYTFEKSRL